MKSQRQSLFFILLIVLLIFLYSPCSYALDSTEKDSSELYAEKKEELSEKYFLRAFTQATASNIVIWGWNYFIIQAPYAKISPETWWKNLNSGFVWDTDFFFVNQIGHPYQGSLYFNAARLHGYSFWESVPFTIYGSFMWELFMERDYPSANDFITTPIGGFAMGEATYRLSLSFLEKRATSTKRVALELISAILNPVLTFNRLLYGDSVLHRNPAPKENISLTLYSGINRTRDEFPILAVTPHPFLGFDLVYGDPYDERKIYKPFDYFRITSGWDLDIKNPGWEIFALSILYGKKLYFKNGARGIMGIYQHFDYLQNFVYSFSSNGFGVGLEAKPLGNKEYLEFKAHLYGIVLGGLDSSYTKYSQKGEYVLGSGAAGKLGFMFTWADFYSSIFYYKYWFHTIRGVASHNTVGIFSISLEHTLKIDFRIGAEIHIYDRWSSIGMDNASRFGARTYLAHTL
ncbi:MAG: DUF3943 domain-containing protein [Spirochaetales bacterium]